VPAPPGGSPGSGDQQGEPSGQDSGTTAGLPGTVPGLPGGDSQQAGEEGAGGATQPTWETATDGGGGAAGEEQTAGTPGTAGTGQGTAQGQAGAEGQPGGSGSGADGEESWESGLPGEGNGGWATSNQLPGATSSIPPMPSERDLPPGGGGTGNPGDGQSSAQGELEKALEVFDGEILAEREVIQARANESAGNTTVASLPRSGSQQGSAGEAGAADSPAGSGQTSFPGRGGPSARSTPPPPNSTANVPDDIPDAKDDDIIARQLREAAMSETDPELQEKLWEEYRRYKNG
jgi:hypothetical protein